jgi:probable phosphoglycerate mutase
VTATSLEYVCLARHGQTEWNQQGRRQGHLDSPLTPAGVLQAERNADLIASLPVDRVFSSPLGRARATAGIIAARLGLPVEVVEELREVHHGRIAGLTDADIERDFPQVAADRARDKYRYRFPDGESYADADLRAGEALRRIEATGARRPLVVSHEMVGRMLLRNLAGLDVRTALACRHPHDVVYRVRIGETRYECLPAEDRTTTGEMP